MNPVLFLSIVFSFFAGAVQSAHAEEQSVLLQVEPLEYSLDIVVDYENEQVAGSCTVTVENTSDKPASHIPFLLYRMLEVTAVTDENSQNMAYRQELTPLKGWEVIEVNSLVITPRNAIQPKESRTVTIEYGGTLKGYAEQGWRYVKDHIDREYTMMRYDGYGYPVLAVPDDTIMYKIAGFRFDYTMNVTVPKGLVVANGGTLTGKRETDTTVCYSYRSIKPSWRMDIAIADYGILQKDGNTVYYFKKDIEGVEKIMNAMETSIRTYSDWFGPLKDFRGFSIIEVPVGYSGQADVTAIMLPSDNLTSPGTIEIVYHEFSHLWNVQPLDETPCRLESEGLAQFHQTLLRQELDGEANAVDAAVERYRERFRNAVEKTPSFMTIPMCDYGVKSMIDYTYTNGMVFFTILYRLCGKEEFNSILCTFISEYGTKGAYLKDFTTHITDNAPELPDAFIQDWVYTSKAADLITGPLSTDEIISLYR